MAKVKVGLIGSGFIAELHHYAYKRVYGVDAEVVAVVSRGDHVLDFAKKHGIAYTISRLQGVAGRQGHRRRRHLHAAGIARVR